MRYLLIILLLINTAFAKEFAYVKKSNVSTKVKTAFSKDFAGYTAKEWQTKKIGLNTYYKANAPLKTNKDEKITFIYVSWTDNKTRKQRCYLVDWYSSIDIKNRLIKKIK